KAQLLARFHRRSGENDALNSTRFQGLGRQSASAVTLARTGGANTEGQAVRLNGIDVSLLGGGSCAEGLGGTLWSVSGFDLLGAGVDFDYVAVVPSLLSGRLPSQLAGLSVV